MYGYQMCSEGSDKQRHNDVTQFMNKKHGKGLPGGERK